MIKKKKKNLKLKTAKCVSEGEVEEKERGGNILNLNKHMKRFSSEL